ncbi:MAG TPA: tRNA (adenosine(37)-N6)-threonylcarbamoyltransferase complex dimerization subunit type 1 TsaB, partial [Nitrospiraceae bacterium]|nr:tRNA (adenosine(37)-N6)-threonylcarbamoyltransferase complex dimerization subunit type 1 TsaB [Nitrospiraceae bacterium]
SDEDAQGAHARRLIPAIDHLLSSCSLTLSSLDGLAVSIGPGSFTGLRVGLATMLGFRLSSGLPLAAVPTLEAMAWNNRDSPHCLCPVLKARTGEVYWAVYQWVDAGRPTRISEERVGSLETMAQSLHVPVVMLGEGWQIYRNELRDLLGPRMQAVLEAPKEAMAASAVSVGLAGLERLARGMVVEAGLSPLYVQRAEAELNWDRKHAAVSAGNAGRPPGDEA